MRDSWNNRYLRISKMEKSLYTLVTLFSIFLTAQIYTGTEDEAFIKVIIGNV